MSLRPILSRVGSNALAVTLADTKAHLRVDHTDDDALITVLIKAAQAYCEDHCRISITTQRWLLRLDAVPDGMILELPRRPLIQSSVSPISPSVTVTSYNSAGTIVETVWTPTGTQFKSWDGNPPVIAFSQEPTLAGNYGLTVEFTAGFGADHTSTPAGLRQAMLMMIGNWYLNREANGGGAGPVPFGVDMLLRQFDSGDYR